ncbi:MAG: hypothetical protein LV480_09395 [Methylacidiphilales bacterium]|nr:hypothetical protein [Candidatus Methylacidiphilales bacterium]
MNYFPALIAVGALGLACYACGSLETQSDAHARQLNDIRAKIAALQSQDKESLQQSKSTLAPSAVMVDLTKQVQALQKAVAAKTNPQAPQAGENQKAKPPPPPSPLNSELGTVTSVDGKTYQNCHLIKVESNCIVFSHSEGIMNLPYVSMQPDLQKVFGFDPTQGATLTDAQVESLEARRQAGSGDINPDD